MNEYGKGAHWRAHNGQTKGPWGLSAEGKSKNGILYKERFNTLALFNAEK
jgi:hypothetical protein